MTSATDFRQTLDTALEGRYTIERELGRGGMGTVVLARDLTLDRLVAIKILPPEMAVREELRERFLRETRTAASFSHPNIVPVHAVESTAGLLCFVMGYVDGETLGQKVARSGPLAHAELVRMLQEVAWALSYAHGRGVVHRDVKPDNILIERATGRALVTDFGIARSVAASQLTSVGEVVGTPQFMSPEQCAGGALDGRSDLYSLGVVAFFAATGALPFQAESTQGLLAMHLTRPAPLVSSLRPDLPGTLAAVIDRCLLKEPGDRFSSGEALVESLETLRSKHVEVAPAIRIFLVKTDSVMRGMLIFTLLTPSILRQGGYDADRLIFGTIFSAAVIALGAQVLVTARLLARQGFRYEDLRDGVLAIDAERNLTLAQLRAAPGAEQRRRRFLMLLAMTGTLATAFIVYGFKQRVRVGDLYHISAWGLRSIVLGGVLAMTTFVFFVAQPGKPNRFERLVHRMWTAALGRFIFRLGSHGIGNPTPGAAGTGGASTGIPGVSTAYEGLPRSLQRQLPGMRPTIERVEGAVESLLRRELELEGAIAEATSGGVGAATANERQRALVTELEGARRQAGERRDLLLGALENVRLSMVRLKSGLGTPQDVEQELDAAAALIQLPAAKA
ncbi:MAG: serine/threonine-protein kinase [Gemmatimonadota bacterium]